MADTRIVDPLGRTIVLHEHTWMQHILKTHPDLATGRLRVHQTLRSPAVICYSRSVTTCRLYYDDLDGAGFRICVVADVLAGLVKTAYRARKIKAGGIEWPASTPSKAT